MTGRKSGTKRAGLKRDLPRHRARSHSHAKKLARRPVHRASLAFASGIGIGSLIAVALVLGFNEPAQAPVTSALSEQVGTKTIAEPLISTPKPLAARPAQIHQPKIQQPKVQQAKTEQPKAPPPSQPPAEGPEDRLAGLEPPVPSSPPSAPAGKVAGTVLAALTPPKSEAGRSGRSGSASIALVLDDLGLSRAQTERAFALPPQVTLAFLPYARSSEQLATEAAARGHEILIHLPMQPQGSDDPGPDALRVDMDDDALRQTIRRNLSRLSGEIGVNNHMGSRSTSDPRVMSILMQELKRADLAFLDSKTSSASVAGATARKYGLRSAVRDVFLDHAAGPDHFLSQLKELETVARRQGTAVAIAHPHDLTLEILEVWVRGLADKGIQLVPLSAVLQPCADDPMPIASSR